MPHDCGILCVCEIFDYVNAAGPESRPHGVQRGILLVGLVPAVVEEYIHRPHLSNQVLPEGWRGLVPDHDLIGAAVPAPRAKCMHALGFSRGFSARGLCGTCVRLGYCGCFSYIFVLGERSTPMIRAAFPK